MLGAMFGTLFRTIFICCTLKLLQDRGTFNVEGELPFDVQRHGTILHPCRDLCWPSQSILQLNGDANSGGRDYHEKFPKQINIFHLHILFAFIFDNTTCGANTESLIVPGRVIIEWIQKLECRTTDELRDIVPSINTKALLSGLDPIKRSFCVQAAKSRPRKH
jgi:hypothetical protein